jgi:glucose/arabinose dehydrogenase
MVMLFAGAAAHAQAPSPVKLEQVFAKLRFRMPIFLTAAPDGSDRLWVVEQVGRIRSFENRADVPAHTLVVDISDRVQAGGEEGLLGLAFHPDVKNNRQVFLHYTHKPGRKTTISRFKLDEKLEKIDPASEEVIFTLEQPYSNHNGGMIAFGPDQMLYITLGDGGAANDPLNSGQRLDTLLGKVLRIDVDHKDQGLGYAIPKDNPFVGRDGAKGEIWALGLRNAWRFSFDRQTGELWAGDVGQNTWEEIDVITKGGNYGWRVREGAHPFNPRKGEKPADMIDPIVEHPRSDAQSITGGYVYRGKAIPALVGAYVYGDYVTGNIWALRREEGKPARPEKLAQMYGGLSSFGEDKNGELYAVALAGYVYKIVPGK